MLKICAVAVVAILGVASCSGDDAPAPGGTDSGTSLVRAPNGTNMGATPINAGTSP